MKWPTGKYNGERIAGAKLSVSVNVFRWIWFLPSKFNRAIGIGPIVIRYETEYEAWGRW